MWTVENPWTNEEIATLRRLWEAGWSGGRIAHEIGRSRAACMGKLWRLGVFEKTRRKASSRKTKERVTPAKPVWRRIVPEANDNQPPVKPPPKPKLPGTLVLLVDLEPHHCRWPVGDPKEMLFCGDAREEARPYCPHHVRIAYQRGK